MDRFTRLLLGFHGCEPDFAEALIRGEQAISGWKPNRNRNDWLGHGIYFWEHAPERAKSWSDRGGVVGAIIQLGLRPDLIDVRYTGMLEGAYETLQDIRSAQGNALAQKSKQTA